MVAKWLELITKLLVWQLAAEDFIVAAAYLWNRDLPRAVYWAAAGVICASTLFIRL